MAAPKREHTDPVKVQELVDDYFTKHAGRETVTGLCIHMGFSSRGSFNHYCEPDPDGIDPVKAEIRDIFRLAKTRVELSYESRLFTEKNYASAIFALKNMGWKDDRSLAIGGKDGEPIPVAVTGIVIKRD